MGRFSRYAPERDALLLRARRLRLAARNLDAKPRESIRALSGIDRLRIRELIEDHGRLVVALKAEMTVIDAELGKVSRQARAAMAYSKANRNVGPSVFRTPPKDRSRL